MDCDPDTLTRLLLDPCLTTDEARREAAAIGWHDRAIGWPRRCNPEATLDDCPERSAANPVDV